ncbi:MAG: dipeptide/oligopeptide/nickel ABC transporter ATP-binding protein, partial [Candidatus Neomarinimicrobiota bacterium]
MQTTNEDTVLLDVRNLKKYFPINEGFLWTRQVRIIKAVDDVSFTVRPGETLGLVGESGCGKTTLGRTILQLYRPTEGHVYFEGEDLAELSGEQLRRTRRKAQMIFQDPYASLNPRMKVANIIEEPLIIHEVENGSQRREAAAHLLEVVGLNSYLGTRFPHELSGGQRQRVAVARAVALRPSLVICDEPVSALDVSIQAQVLNLLIALQEQFGLTYIFIAHDLSVVSLMSDWGMVMYLGHVV